MRIELEIIRASEFIRMGTSGQLDLVSSCALLTNLAHACRRRGIPRALLDIRNSQAELSPTDLASLADTFHEAGFGRRERLAILHAVDRYQRARLFALINWMKGWSVRAFDKFEDALCWLSDDQEETQSGKRTGPKQLNLTHDDREAKPAAIKSHHYHKSERHSQVVHHQNRYASSYPK